MKASEARKIYEDGSPLDKEKLNEMYSYIDMKARAGFTTTTMNHDTKSKAIIKQLQEDGFKCVLVVDQRDGDFWQIEW